MTHRNSEAVLRLVGHLSLGHLCEGNDDEHEHHDAADSHIGIADNVEVVQPDRGSLGSGQRGEDDFARSIATVGDEIGQHH